MKTDFYSKKYPSFTDLIIFLSLYLVISSLVGIAVSSLGKLLPNIPNANDIIMSVSYILSFIILIIIVSYYRSRRNPNFKSLRLIRKHTPTSPTYILWGIISVTAISFTINPLVLLFPESVNSLFSVMSEMGTYLTLTCVFIAPVVEEMLFRGIVQSDLNLRYNSTISIIITSLIFGLIHMNPAQIISAFFVSLALGTIYEITKSLWTVILIHFFNNAASVMLFKLYKDEASFNKPYINYFENPTIYYILYCLAATISLLTIYKLFSLKKCNSNITEQTENKEAKPTSSDL